MDKRMVSAVLDGEYATFVELAANLSDEQWDRPSLCDDWAVGEVLWHLAYHTHKSGVRGVFTSQENVLAKLIGAELVGTRDGLFECLELPRPKLPAFETEVNVCELVIHSQDIRRAIAVPHTFPEPAMRVALDRCVTMLGTIFVVGRTRRVAPGVRLVATDLEWSYGAGPEVRAPAEALLMAIAARPAALADLTGEGVMAIARRLGVDLAISGVATS